MLETPPPNEVVQRHLESRSAEYAHPACKPTHLLLNCGSRKLAAAANSLVSGFGTIAREKLDF